MTTTDIKERLSRLEGKIDVIQRTVEYTRSRLDTLSYSVAKLLGVGISSGAVGGAMVTFILKWLAG